MAMQGAALPPDSAAAAAGVPARAANPLAAHAAALSDIEAQAERVRELLHCAAQDDCAAAACRSMQAAYVQRSFDDLARSVTTAARNGPHGTALHATRAFTVPQDGSGRQLKRHMGCGLLLLQSMMARSTGAPKSRCQSIAAVAPVCC